MGPFHDARDATPLGGNMKFFALTFFILATVTGCNEGSFASRDVKSDDKSGGSNGGSGKNGDGSKGPNDGSNGPGDGNKVPTDENGVPCNPADTKCIEDSNKRDSESGGPGSNGPGGTTPNGPGADVPKGPGGTPGGNPDKINEVLSSDSGFSKSCLAAKRLPKQTLTFPQRVGCAWNQNGNLGYNNGYMQARHEEERIVNMPAGAIVCNLSIRSQKTTAKLRYDDALFLTVNSVVLLSDSTWNTLKSDPKNPTLSLWNFTRVRGLYHQSTPQFCFGESCQLPPTETVGELNYSLGRTKGFELAKFLKSPSSLNVKLIVTGDDDPGHDCSHSTISLDVDVDYVIP